ncbi:MAG TPA: VOC family protein [Candidatus Paceibacterota bacterium]|nr:VOC family protein [Candidatus Paceibacterota bacterium]
MSEQKITTFIWYEKDAEKAAQYYVDVFNNNPAKKQTSKVITTSDYKEASEEVSGQKAGTPMVIEFNLEGQEFMALNGGSYLKLSGAVSLMVDCETQEEVDYFWEKLGEGGETGQCGWINRDKFGMTWQIVPSALGKLMSDPDEEKSERVMKAMLGMTKIDIAGLQKAYDNK